MKNFSDLQEQDLHLRIMEGKTNNDQAVRDATRILKVLGLDPNQVEHVISEDGEDQIISPINSRNSLTASRAVMANLAKTNKFIGLFVEEGYATVLVQSENR